MPAYWLYVYFLCFPFHSLVLALNYIMCILTSFCANRKWNYCISISGVPFSHFWEVVGEAVEMMMMWRQARNLLERDLSLFSVTNIHPCQKWRFILTLKKSFEFRKNGECIMILNILWSLSDPQICIRMFNVIFVISGVLASFWEVFIEYRWHGQTLK